MTQTMSDHVDSKVEEAMNTAMEITDQAADMIEKAHLTVETSMKDRPLTTLGIAVVAGLVLGALWKS